MGSSRNLSHPHREGSTVPLPLNLFLQIGCGGSASVILEVELKKGCLASSWFCSHAYSWNSGIMLQGAQGAHGKTHMEELMSLAHSPG